MNERYIVVRKPAPNDRLERLKKVMDAYDTGGMDAALSVIKDTAPEAAKRPHLSDGDR